MINALLVWFALLLQQAPGPAPPPTSVPVQDLRDWRALWDAGRLEDAVDRLQDDLSRTPEDAALRAECARRQLEVHRYAAALQTAEPLGDALPHVAAQALYLLGRHEEALQRLDPAHPMETLMRVDALEMLGRPAETWAAVERAAAVRGSKDPPLLAVQGRLLAAEGRHAEAVAHFEAALRADPFHPAARHGLGQSLLRIGRRDEGLAQLEEHRRLAPLIDRLESARRAVQLGPFHPDNHALLGDVLRELRRPDEAEASYRRAAELCAPPVLAPVLLRHARLLVEDRAQVDAAVTLLDEGLMRCGDLRLLVRAGDILADAGRFDEAVARFEAALAARPEDAAIATRLASARESADEDEP